MGWGWKGKTVLQRNIYHRSLSEDMLRFLRFVESKGYPLGCRDWYTVRFLKNHGFQNVMMTGCPAWYDLERIADLTAKKVSLQKEDLKICVSDAAFRHNIGRMRSLVIHLRNKYPSARIRMVFHSACQGNKKDLIQQEFLDKYTLEYSDISGSAEGFELYDSCDLHIGFRVHAHIYCLSRGGISILVNEDARGNGVNDALGLANISLLPRELSVLNNDDLLCRQVDDYIDFIEDTECLQYMNACANMRHYFGEMQKWLKRLAE